MAPNYYLFLQYGIEYSVPEQVRNSIESDAKHIIDSFKKDRESIDSIIIADPFEYGCRIITPGARIIGHARNSNKICYISNSRVEFLELNKRLEGLDEEEICQLSATIDKTFLRRDMFNQLVEILKSEEAK